MIQIRRSVFETNSSSAHSLVIKKESSRLTEEEIKNSLWVSEGKFRVDYACDDMDFGRSPFEILDNIGSKLKYLYASYANDSEKIDEITELVKKLSGCETVLFPTESDSWDTEKDKENYYGYIDHASADLLNNMLTERDVSFEEFLTDRRYIVVIDGDEYAEWAKLKRAKLIDLNEIEAEYGGCSL